MSEKICDHKSVGMLVRKGEALLLIERRKPPFGFAPPAGHVDGDASFELAAKRELSEEVGLTAKSLKLVLEQDVPNPCRRLDGTWHHWKVYEVVAAGAVRPSADETKQAGLHVPRQIMALAQRTQQYLAGTIAEEEWQQNPGLEPVWYEHFKTLGIL